MGGGDLENAPGTVAPKEKPSIPLGTHLGMEFVAAGLSAASVSPFISIIDKAIFSNASGREHLLPGLFSGFKTLVTSPVTFVRQPSFLIVFGTYHFTYTVANFTQTICDHNLRPWFYPKFIATSVANVSASLGKDIYFTKAFAKPGAPSRAVPLASYLLYTSRDTMTIYGSFNLPGMFSNYVQSQGLVKDPHSAETLAQLVTPLAVQFVSCPLHLTGMDLYNRPGVTVGHRLEFIRKEYLGTALARCARIFPAYGIGGVLNTHLRKVGRGYLDNAGETASSADLGGSSKYSNENFED
ncbi:hypothetical protein BJ742DRAFT_829997 [Cladochytrium replicatum]|nr:hypothetical protein BJ742DRAFT_829997 [Cladochytrium replicatum]